ncbi:alpha/beta hydrolase [Polyangium jinanense]|uniref:Alpha/beta hydrolase n=1 Tax=Polyangium jinanense TaxID=2829994 RepID=A0A9X3X9X4_9BACT|nr:alpha/beta hydrolase [Polyangium jinanense]MDC3957446.1 alpha/beta hydrolase [Polyangium jinanense]MDC3985063.1 alpha/beta hydrolase [Polyangium jinanense]
MLLSPLARARIKVARSLADAIRSSKGISARLLGFRARPVEGCTVDLDLALMLALDDVLKSSDLRGFAPPVARARMAESVCMVEIPRLDSVSVVDERLRGDAGPIPARRYVPEGLAAPSPCVVFYHGGGFVTGDLDTHDSFCRQLAIEGRVRVIAVDYRLAPEHRFPAAATDAVAAFRDVAARAADFGVDPARIAVMGDSAGGNLSAVVSLKTRGEAHRPALQVLLYPGLDATCAHRSHAVYANGWMLTKGMIDWYYEHYFGPDPAVRRHPDGSPLLAPSVEGAPPALVFTAGFDPLRDEGAAYVERLTAAGVPVRLVCHESMIHGFVLMGGVAPACREETSRIIREASAALRNGFS